jgi:hypothetical protein
MLAPRWVSVMARYGRYELTSRLEAPWGGILEMAVKIWWQLVVLQQVGDVTSVAVESQWRKTGIRRRSFTLEESGVLIQHELGVLLVHGAEHLCFVPMKLCLVVLVFTGLGRTSRLIHLKHADRSRIS